MKLATLKDTTRDGRLVVVSRDLTRCSDVGHIARTLQEALDDWAYAGPRLERVAEGLETGAQPTMRFHEHHAASPLPRAYQWLAAARGADAEPSLHQGGSDSFRGPRDPVIVTDKDSGVEMQGGVAVIVGDVPMGASEEEGRAAIRLVLLVNDMSLRGSAKPPAAFSPAAVTPDELGGAWDGGRLRLPLLVSLDGKPSGPADAGVAFDFGQLIAQAARARPLSAGSVIGSGPVSGGAARTVRIEMKDKAGHSIFGAIEQTVTSAAEA